ncbi:carotenoid oxygenase family protein [Streptosporangium roseum]|uniref:carotenoid oxygenase family protein n=1 Tax=Streptosporangium roseum TaxID=2001 RepID=UPI00332BC456
MTPLYLRGFLAPVPDEIDAFDLPVSGALPPALTGRYFRNGPNPLPGRDPGHWFTGPGMVHGVRLRDGRAEWYRNRWVRTREFTEDAPFVRDDLSVDLTAVPANTHVIPHGDKIFALVENGLPYELTAGLETVGPCDFGGLLTTAMTAHPKRDPLTGELLFFGYGFLPPYLTYHRLSADGELVESREIPVPGPTMMHDFAITAGHVVWMDLPVVFDLALAEGGGMPYRWDDRYGARLGVMPRTGAAGVTWSDINPCYVFHTANAHEDGSGRVVLDTVRYTPAEFAAVWDDIGGSAHPAARAAVSGTAHLHRYVLTPGAAAHEEQLDDLDVEFPTLHDGRTGDRNRYLYAVSSGAIVKYDVRSGASILHKTGPDRMAGEAVFVPAEDARGEDEGWLISIVTGGPGVGSELLVLDAVDLSRVASVRLPRRVPAGFHGSWIQDG